MILPRKDMLEMAIEDQEDIEVREVGLDRLEEMEQWDQWDPLDQGDFPGRDGLSTTGGPLTSTGLGISSYFQCKFEHHWYGEFVPLFRRITKFM